MKKNKIICLLTLLSLMTMASCNNDKPNTSFDSNNTSKNTNSNVTASSAKILTLPSKISYYPGEIFDITGLSVEVTMSNQSTDLYFDSDFSNWTHKDEPLTENIDEIMVDIPNTTLKIKIDITVGVGNSKLLLDTSSINESYNLGEIVDMSKIKVKLVEGDKITNLTNDEWTIYEGDTQITNLAKYETNIEGKHTFLVKFRNALTATFIINFNNPTSIISPSYIEAEECVFKLNQNEETDEKWTDNVTNLTSAEYFDENNKSVQQWGIYNGASGNMIEKLTNNAKNLYFKFKVTAPKADDYQLFARVQSDFDESSLSVAEGVYKISIDNEPEVLSNEFTIYPANQLKNYVDTKDLKYARYYNMEWWNYVKLGTLHLKQGENTIKIKIDNSLNVRVPNIDFFEIKTNDYTINNEIYSMRTKKKVDLTKNSIYLTQGEELTDLCVARFGSEPLDSRCPTKYTYIYVRLDDGREIPVLPSMLSNLDYQKIGEQEVTATIKNLTNNKVEITKSFKVLIQGNMEK